MNTPCSRRRWLLATGALLTAPVTTPLRAADFWARAGEPGTVVLLRHALTEPGTGDPPQFRLGECATQRNLSEAGREQSRRIGRAFVAASLAPVEVRSSAWCRCVDTARLAFGTHRVWAPLNSFFGARDTGAQQTQAVLDGVRAHTGAWPLVLVTHQVNISALTGQYPAMGELFAARLAPADKRLQVVARLVV